MGHPTSILPSCRLHLVQMYAPFQSGVQADALLSKTNHAPAYSWNKGFDMLVVAIPNLHDFLALSQSILPCRIFPTVHCLHVQPMHSPPSWPCAIVPRFVHLLLMQLFCEITIL